MLVLVLVVLLLLLFKASIKAATVMRRTIKGRQPVKGRPAKRWPVERLGLGPIAPRRHRRGTTAPGAAKPLVLVTEARTGITVGKVLARAVVRGAPAE